MGSPVRIRPVAPTLTPPQQLQRLLSGAMNYSSLVQAANTSGASPIEIAKLSSSYQNPVMRESLIAINNSFEALQFKYDGSELSTEAGRSIFQSRSQFLSNRLDMRDAGDIASLLNQAESASGGNPRSMDRFAESLQKQMAGSLERDPTKAFDKLLSDPKLSPGDRADIARVAQMAKQLMDPKNAVDANGLTTAGKFQQAWKKEMQNRETFQKTLDDIGKGQGKAADLSKWAKGDEGKKAFDDHVKKMNDIRNDPNVDASKKAIATKQLNQIATALKVPGGAAGLEKAMKESSGSASKVLESRVEEEKRLEEQKDEEEKKKPEEGSEGSGDGGSEEKK